MNNDDAACLAFCIILIAASLIGIALLVCHNNEEIDSSEYVQVSKWSEECENVKLVAQEALASDGKISNREYAKIKILYTDRDKIAAEKKAKAEILEAEKKAKENILSDNVPEGKE